ncbi:hypothetical protein [Plebeiibacterium sediminum]|uniref:Uncharacterized protein n=1 Tax=Plebeiibacterium sediminum TaxID=2992112 RepID=A0AAE3M530_9BACT|nr:hypothetical protein [Plebeiobacterium sediminum]MCW3787086.1 hypothetical protein [Plebeiobacterium sediminum]
MEYTKATAIDYFFSKIDAKEMEFSSVRKTLERDGFGKDDINTIVRQVDKQLIKAEELRASYALGKNLFYGGLFLAVAGALLTIGTYTGIINIGNRFLIAYGPIAAGLITALTGKAKMNRL